MGRIRSSGVHARHVPTVPHANDAMRKPPKTIEDEYGVDCRDCRYSVKTGAAEFLANEKARRHSLQHAGHRVRVTQMHTLRVWAMSEYVVPLDDEPPF